MLTKKVITIVLAGCFLGVAALAAFLIIITSNLPQLITVADYKPLLVSEVFDRNGEKIGEFFRERRLIATVEELPPHLLQAFVASEDAAFYEHSGINYLAILRAAWANLKAGRRAQGASTITQQVARSLLLTSHKTYTRKIKEAILAQRMEKNLSKDDILYLYLNQIYLGQGAYGVKTAAEVYFRKSLQDVSIAEAALLAGLPQAPSRYSPVYNPSAAKARQKYVLTRMAEEGFISKQQAIEEINKPIKVFIRKNYKKDAPFYLETVRQMLVKEIGEQNILDRGVKIYTGLDITQQREAQNSIKVGLRELDKRQGFRGPKKNLTDPQEIADFLLKSRNTLMDEHSPERIIQPDGSLPKRGPLDLNELDKDGQPIAKILPKYIDLDSIVDAIVTNVDDKWGLVQVRFAENKGLIDMESMKWARKPDPKSSYKYNEIEKPSVALKVGDIIQVKIIGRKFYSTRIGKDLKDIRRDQKDKYERPVDLPEFKFFHNVELEQEPIAEASMIAFDQKSADITALVGGYDFAKSQFNRALQALRQTGSSFKALVYASALDKGFTPSTKIIDAPLIYEEEKKIEDSDEVEIKKWKPNNYAKKFTGDILFRNALIRSMNVPTVKIIEKTSVEWAEKYARRLGIFSPLNMDFTLALGSSSVTLYEMTKAFAQFGRMGKRLVPIIIHRVEDKDGELIVEKLSLDSRFQDEFDKLNEDQELKRQAYLKWQEAQENLKDQSLEETEQLSPLDPKSLADAKAPTSEEAAAVVVEDKFAKVNFAKEPPLYFKDPDQLMKPSTAYIITNILQGVIEEPGGTGGRARALGRPAAGKTGTTSGFYDAWFIGYTPDYAAGVWVGYDDERSLGVGEGGGKTALPIWVEFMKTAHQGRSEKNFRVPEGIVFSNIDNDTGEIASANSKKVVRQAYFEGTEPQVRNSNSSAAPGNDDDVQDFYKQDLSE